MWSVKTYLLKNIRFKYICVSIALQSTIIIKLFHIIFKGNDFGSSGKHSLSFYFEGGLVGGKGLYLVRK